MGLSMQPGFNIPPYTAVYGEYPDTVTEIYTYYDGATLVATVTAIYTDATKKYLVSGVKT